MNLILSMTYHKVKKIWPLLGFSWTRPWFVNSNINKNVSSSFASINQILNEVFQRFAEIEKSKHLNEHAAFHHARRFDHHIRVSHCSIHVRHWKLAQHCRWEKVFKAGCVWATLSIVKGVFSDESYEKAGDCSGQATSSRSSSLVIFGLAIKSTKLNA